MITLSTCISLANVSLYLNTFYDILIQYIIVNCIEMVLDKLLKQRDNREAIPLIIALIKWLGHFITYKIKSFI